MHKGNTLISILKTIFWMGFILSFSIAFPIVCRPFYYLHINFLKLPEITGYTYQQIKQAFDEMLSFGLYGGEFSTGVLKWSESGRSHFVDCAGLFRLDFTVLFISVVGLAVCSVLEKRTGKKQSSARGSGFWAGVILLVCFIMVSLYAARDFSAFFVLFHRIFFPGKSNWYFDADMDEIINILPEIYFRNCAISIVVLLMTGCVVLILKDRKKNEK